MWSSLSEIEKALNASVSEAWPELLDEATLLPLGLIRLKPLVNTEWGDFTSDVLLRVAEKLRIKCEDAAVLLLQKLPLDLKRHTQLSREHLNFNFGKQIFSISVTSDCRSRGRAGVFLSANQCSGFERLAARASLQASALSKIDVENEFWFGEEPLQERGQALFDRLITTKTQGGPFNIPELISRSNENKLSHLTIWTPAENLGAVFNQDYNDRIRGECIEIMVRSPARSWMGPLDKIGNSGMRDAEKLAFIYYLASDLPAIDLDLAVPLLAEQANLSWYGSNVISRIRASIPTLCGEAGDEYLSLQRLVHLIPLFHERAGFYGEVEQFLSVLRLIFDEATKILNNPTVRQTLASNNSCAAASVLWQVVTCMENRYI